VKSSKSTWVKCEITLLMRLPLISSWAKPYRKWCTLKSPTRYKEVGSRARLVKAAFYQAVHLVWTVYCILLFVVKNREFFTANNEVHDINTRYNSNLYLPSTKRSIVQKGVLFSGSKIYNHLPLNIKLLSNDIEAFKLALKSFLIENVFYSTD
jgi:hypothetical protein